MVHQFTFKGFEKALGYRVIPTVTPATHAQHQWQGLQLIAEFIAGLSHPSIRMKQEFTLYAPVFESHPPGCHTRFNGLKGVAHGSEIKSHLRSAQPITFRSAKSSTVVKYNQPSPVGI